MPAPRPLLLLLVFAAILGTAFLAIAAPARQRSWHLVPGSFEPNRGPDGNSLFLDAPGGLILVDTGRHPEHRDRLLAFARDFGRPIAAILNTHWHLDHSTGNGDIRAAFPEAPLFATGAIEGALAGFIADSRRQMEAMLAAGEVPPQRESEVRRFLTVVEAPDALRPTRRVDRSGPAVIAGRRLVLNVAPFAATEADLWIHDPEAGLVVAGDLVVAEVPFMDTACPEGWRRALDAIAATDFTILVPGHGEPMDKGRFLAWRAAFANLLDCAASDAARDACIAGWRRDAALFQRPGREQLIDRMTGYYLDTRLRAAPEERDRYCPAPG